MTASIRGWLHDLPLAGLVLTVFAVTFLAAAAVYLVVMALARKRGAAFKAVSPGMLPPMGILFALLVGFLAAQVWSDAGRAQEAVNHEASALRSVVIFAQAFPGEPETRMDALVRRHIQTAAEEEWPAMAHQRATLTGSRLRSRKRSSSPSVCHRAPKARRRHNVRSWIRSSPRSTLGDSASS